MLPVHRLSHPVGNGWFVNLCSHFVEHSHTRFSFTPLAFLCCFFTFAVVHSAFVTPQQTGRVYFCPAMAAMEGRGDLFVDVNVGGTHFVTHASVLVTPVESPLGTVAGDGDNRVAPATFFSALIREALERREAARCRRRSRAVTVNEAPAVRSSADSNSGSDDAGADTTVRIVVDRSPDFFAVVLHFLRYRRWRFPPELDGPQFRSDVFDEMEFFGFGVPLCSATLRWHTSGSSGTSASGAATIVGVRCDPAFAALCQRAVDPLFVASLATAVNGSGNNGGVGSRVLQPRVSVVVAPTVETVLRAFGSALPRPNLKYKLAIALRGCVQCDAAAELLLRGPPPPQPQTSAPAGAILGTALGPATTTGAAAGVGDAGGGSVLAPSSSRPATPLAAVPTGAAATGAGGSGSGVHAAVLAALQGYAAERYWESSLAVVPGVLTVRTDARGDYAVFPAFPSPLSGFGAAAIVPSAVAASSASNGERDGGAVFGEAVYPGAPPPALPGEEDEVFAEGVFLLFIKPAVV